eukprot:2214537-Amphidinium_carterae.1
MSLQPNNYVATKPNAFMPEVLIALAFKVHQSEHFILFNALVPSCLAQQVHLMIMPQLVSKKAAQMLNWSPLNNVVA